MGALDGINHRDLADLHYAVKKAMKQAKLMLRDDKDEV